MITVVFFSGVVLGTVCGFVITAAMVVGRELEQGESAAPAREVENDAGLGDTELRHWMPELN